MKRSVRIAIAAAAVSLAAIYFMFDPARMPFPRCPFLMATGLKCPGCGSQRAIHSLLHLDISAAWHYNAMLVATLPYLALLVTAGRSGTLYRRLNHSRLILAYCTAVVLWWILRNVFDW